MFRFFRSKNFSDEMPEEETARGGWYATCEYGHAIWNSEYTSQAKAEKLAKDHDETQHNSEECALVLKAPFS